MKIAELEETIRKVGVPTLLEKFIHFFGFHSYVYEETKQEIYCTYTLGVPISGSEHLKNVQYGTCKICKKQKKVIL